MAIDTGWRLVLTQRPLMPMSPESQSVQFGALVAEQYPFLQLA